MPVFNATISNTLRPPLARAQIKNITGQRFDQLFIIGFLGVDHRKRATWLALCDCGTFCTRALVSLSGEQPHSCGCYGRERLLRYTTKHGLARSATYRSWDHMVQRCVNPNNDSFHRYGERGITVCANWRVFSNFVQDLGERPIEHSLDRIANDGNYSCGHCQQCTSKQWPMNCRWATRGEQAKNTSRTRMITYRGETRCAAEWIQLLGIRGS